MVKVAEPIWLGIGIALVAFAAYTLAITPNVHEPLMLLTFSLGLGILGVAAIASGAFLGRWPRAVAAGVSGVLAIGVLIALGFYVIYVGSSLGHPG